MLKWLPDAPSGLFEAEAAGLTALRDSGSPLVIPRVVTASWLTADVDGTEQPSFLVLEYLSAGPRVADFDERLGRGLAALHRTTRAQYGFTQPTYCGATLQPNPWADRWIEFYAVSRLGHQLDLAARGGRVDGGARQRIERLISRLDTWLSEPPEGPALIHGDLWSGNLHVTPDGLPALIDPAVHFAHREAELGMMTLFGGFSPRVFDAYHEAFPLDAGWRERTDLYQLYHLLNHLNLFGGSYHDGVMAVVRRYA